MPENFHPGRPESYEKASDQELVSAIAQGYGPAMTGALQAELMLRLRRSIIEFNEASGRQSSEMIVLNQWLRALTIGLVILTFAQIAFMVYLSNK